jgi:hypothetical protein
MILHLKNIATNEIKRNTRYAGSDISIPIIGMDENLQYYYEEADQIPAFNERTHQIVRNEAWTEETHETYTHLKKLHVTWQTNQLSNEQIIANLNEAIGVHLDGNYPLPIRIKHLKEGVEITLLGNARTEDQNIRLAYLTSLGDWMNTCRAERDAQESALINDGTLPTFQFIEKP